MRHQKSAFYNAAFCKQGCQPFHDTFILKLLIKVDNPYEVFYQRITKRCVILILDIYLQQKFL